VVALLAITLISRVAICYWGADKGFDVGDEGNYIYTTKFISNYGLVSDYYYLMSFVYDFLNIDIISARLLRIVSEILSIFLFSVGLFLWARSRHSLFNKAPPGFGLIFLFCGLGAFLSVYARGFSYNDLSNLLLYTSGAGFLYVESLDHDNSFGLRAKSVLILVGFILGWQLFIKFPGSILFFSLYLIYLAIKNVTIGSKVGMILSLFLGYLLAILLFFDLYGNVYDWFAKIFKEMALDDQNVGEILAFYLSKDYPSLLIILLGVLCFFIIVNILKRTSLGSHSADRIHTAALGISVAIQVGVHLIYPYRALENQVLLIVAFVAISMGIALAIYLKNFLNSRWIKDAISRENVLIIVGLILMPFAIMIGTNSSLTETVLQNIVPWFGLIIITIYYLAQRFELRWFYLTLMIMFIISSQLFFVYHFIFDPWQMDSRLTDNKYTVDGLEPIKFDTETRDFFEAMISTFEGIGFEKGDPVIALDATPGIVYLLGGVSPGFPFYQPGIIPDSDHTNCHYIMKLPLTKMKKPIIIYRIKPNLGMTYCLNVSGLNFQEDYYLAGKVKNPYVNEYRYFYDPDEYRYFHIYAPKNEQSLN